MILIKKGESPVKFQQYCKYPQATFDDMDSDAKESLRTSLVKEQGYICAYCMKRIKNDHTTKIEHYHPRNSENELKYGNLLAVCSGNSGKPLNEQTCDTRKGDRELYIDPQNPEHMQCIRYRPNGMIYSTDERADDDLNDILNLNCPTDYLIPNRKKAYQTIVSIIHAKCGNRQAARSFLTSLEKYYLNKDKKEEYTGVLLYFIRKHR